MFQARRFITSKSPIWQWSVSRARTARVLEFAFSSVALTRHYGGEHYRTRRGRLDKGGYNSSIREWQKTRGKRRGGNPVYPFDGVFVRVGSIWDSAHQIFRYAFRADPRWERETHPAYRETERLVSFDISTDPKDENAGSPPPYEFHITFPPQSMVRWKNKALVPVAVRLLDFSYGVIAESLLMAPLEKNLEIAYRRLAVARAAAQRRIPLPGVHWLGNWEWQRTDKIAFMKLVAEVRNIDWDGEVNTDEDDEEEQGDFEGDGEA